MSTLVSKARHFKEFVVYWRLDSGSEESWFEPSGATPSPISRYVTSGSLVLSLGEPFLIPFLGTTIMRLLPTPSSFGCSVIFRIASPR